MISKDLLYMQNNGINVISPSVAMSEITMTVCEMLEENLQYVKKNGLNDSAKKSRERLLHLLNITETFNKLSCDNAALQTFNNRLLAENQQLINQLAEIKRQENLGNAL